MRVIMQLIWIDWIDFEKKSQNYSSSGLLEVHVDFDWCLHRRLEILVFSGTLVIVGGGKML